MSQVWWSGSSGTFGRSNHRSIKSLALLWGQQRRQRLGGIAILGNCSSTAKGQTIFSACAFMWQAKPCRTQHTFKYTPPLIIVYFIIIYITIIYPHPPRPSWSPLLASPAMFLCLYMYTGEPLELSMRSQEVIWLRSFSHAVFISVNQGMLILPLLTLSRKTAWHNPGCILMHHFSNPPPPFVLCC